MLAIPAMWLRWVKAAMGSKWWGGINEDPGGFKEGVKLDGFGGASGLRVGPSLVPLDDGFTGDEVRSEEGVEEEVGGTC